MSVTAHRTEHTDQRPAGVPAPRVRPAAERVAAPPRRVRVHGYSGPPTRRRVAGAPRVVRHRACPPRQRLSIPAMLAVGASVCLAVVGLGLLADSGAGAVPERTEVVRVQPGESLTELAARMAPSSDQAAVVDRIRDLNGALAEDLQPGRPLRVPSEG
ncbi:LysM peptidoglycan-binding domain-containing protein [Actinophytocola gossypii]|uniref:LysM peptidoglycan-binding domain-containing protein n=1 Tax=Actinophytocola gossypii TaxID=2812003 RepID=A0ABT2J9T1_9PSEU|nr:LysM peptidoglycan-binding domain-containing protein [Actinophytocola gossypii]MCT2584034.1 LysM peptidoglycan-binding domain-containing protein [Actinophytocola gossypii]